MFSFFLDYFGRGSRGGFQHECGRSEGPAAHWRWHCGGVASAIRATIYQTPSRAEFQLLEDVVVGVVDGFVASITPDAVFPARTVFEAGVGGADALGEPLGLLARKNPGPTLTPDVSRSWFARLAAATSALSGSMGSGRVAGASLSDNRT